MATEIEWAQNPDGTPGETWNPTVGCSRKSEGCKNCYAFASHDMRHEAFKSGKKLPQQYAEPFTVIQLKPDRLDKPLHWKKPRGVFVNSVSDLFHEEVPFDFVDSVFAVMALTPRHTYRVLTKRPERMAEYAASRRKSANYWKYAVPTGWSLEYRGLSLVPYPLPNVFLGCTVENQKRADERREHLQSVASLRWQTFVSYEPALELVDWTGWEFIQQLIIGGESGKGARAFNVAWARVALWWCRDNSIAAFLKQLGSNAYDHEEWPGVRSILASKAHDFGDGEGPAGRLQLRDPKGGDWSEWKEEYRVREFPRPLVEPPQ